MVGEDRVPKLVNANNSAEAKKPPERIKAAEEVKQEAVAVYPSPVGAFQQPVSEKKSLEQQIAPPPVQQKHIVEGWRIDCINPK